MSSSVFTEIGIGGRLGERADRLFRGAVSAFCSLPRPSREDATRIDDLTLPLLDQVSLASRRFAAAALSECEQVPHELSRRLCDDTIEVAAPLLIRLDDLSDVELLGLISRHGLAHAKAIGHRESLNPVIRSLIGALGHSTELSDPAPALAPVVPAPVDAARRNLRGMMRPAEAPGALGRRATFLRLRDSALSGRAAFFETSLADALGIWFEQAQAALRQGPGSSFAVALRALGLRSDEAFLLSALLFPAAFGTSVAIGAYLNAYDSVTPDTVRETLSLWRAEAQSSPELTARKA